MGTIREEVVEIGGKAYKITSDDDYLDHIKNGFEPDMVALFQTVASGSNVILDVGANIGCTAVLFGDLAQKVYAFEPSGTTYQFLEKNIAQSGHKQIYPQKIGLGADFLETTIAFDPDNRSGGYVSNRIQANENHTIEKIEIQPMDAFVAAHHLQQIDFIKMDVEGFEGDVLRGAKETLAANKPVVVLELNHWCLNAFQRTSVPDFFDQLRAIFPILYAVDGRHYMDLHDDNESFVVMYYHILHGKFSNILAGYDEQRFAKFKSQYHRGFEPQAIATIVEEKPKSLLGRLFSSR